MNANTKNELTRIGCRTFQAGLNIGARALYWRKPITVTGEGCSAKIPEIMKREGVKRVMVVTGRHVGKSIAPRIIAALREAGVDCVHFSEVEANPTTTIVDKITWQYRLNACDGILAIGPTGSTCSPSCTNSIIDDFFSQSSASIASDTYTLCFASDGYLSLGDADASLYDGPIAWIPCSSPNTYQFTITGIEVDGESIGPVGAELFSDS